MKNKRKKADWLTIIPILFWLSCMAFSLAKLYQSGNEIHIIDYIEIFNSNTFSTFISMVICMALALNDAYKNDFDILAYADMLFWIEQYNISRL